jgi:hypothetical protein
MSTADRSELEQRLNLSTRLDGNWHNDYRELANIINDLAQTHEQKSFSAAKNTKRHEIIKQMISVRRSQRSWRLRAFFALDSPEFIKTQRSTIPHLLRLYRLSGVPWRQRGYTSWPGVGGETFAYMREMASPGC